MIQVIISVAIIILAVSLILIKNYKKVRAIKEGKNICKSLDCNGCKSENICNNSEKKP